MKKKISFLLITLLIIPNVANASNFCPFTSHERIVTNQDGIDLHCSTYGGNTNCCEKYNDDGECLEPVDIIGKMKQDEKFILYGENTNSLIIYNNEYYSIDGLEGTKVAKEVVIPEENMEDDSIHKINEHNEAIIYATEGVDIRKGPAKAYDVIGHIEKGTKFKYTYYYNGACIEYIYTEYNGIKGWIETNDKVFLETQETYLTIKDINISNKTIPKDTILDVHYYVPTNSYSQKILINYENTEGVFDTENEESLLLFDKKYTPTTNNQVINVYEYSNNEGKILTTIPINEEYEIIGNYYNSNSKETFLYINYNGIKGWISDPNQNNTKEPTTVEKETWTNYITYYIIACSAIIVVTVIIVILINKKKTKKEIN